MGPRSRGTSATTWVRATMHDRRGSSPTEARVRRGRRGFPAWCKDGGGVGASMGLRFTYARGAKKVPRCGRQMPQIWPLALVVGSAREGAEAQARAAPDGGALGHRGHTGGSSRIGRGSCFRSGRRCCCQPPDGIPPECASRRSWVVVVVQTGPSAATSSCARSCPSASERRVGGVLAFLGEQRRRHDPRCSRGTDIPVAA